MSKTAFISGASGFIGSHISERLYNLGYKVFAVIARGERLPKATQVLDLNLNGIAWDLVPKIDICFHQAANNDTTDMNRERMLRANFTAPVDLFYRLNEKKKCRKFVYASSASVYGHQKTAFSETAPTQPLNPYAESKLLFDGFASMFSMEYKTNVIGLRYTNVYGPGEEHKGKRASMIHQLLHQMRSGKRPKIFSDGEQLRDWVYIQDVVDANLVAAECPSSGVYNIGAGENISFNRLVTLLNELLETNYEPEYVECPFRQAYQDFTLADLSKVKKELNWHPQYSIAAGVRKFVEETKTARI